MVWTGTPTGTFSLWRTNRPDANQDGTADTGWDQVPTAEVDFTGKQPAGSASQSFIEISRVSAWKYRLKYVNASSSGNIWCYVHIPPAR